MGKQNYQEVWLYAYEVANRLFEEIAVLQLTILLSEMATTERLLQVGAKRFQVTFNQPTIYLPTVFAFDAEEAERVSVVHYNLLCFMPLVKYGKVEIVECAYPGASHRHTLITIDKCVEV